jgi:glycosyltransferase 2 family protein
LSQQLKSVLQFLLFFGLGGALLYFAFVNLDLDYDKVLNGFKQANYGWIAAALVFSLASHFVRAIRWNMMLEPLGTKPPILNTFNAVMIGYLFNFAIPRMGEVSRCGVLNRTDKIPVNQSLGTVVVERIFDMIILMIATLLVLLLQFDVLYNFFNENFISPLALKFQGLGLFILILIVATLAGAIIALLRFKHILLRSALAAKILTLLLGFVDGFKSVLKLKSPAQFFGSTILIWVLYYLNTFSFLMAFTETANIGFAAVMSILVIGTFGFAAPVSGGIGAYHLFVAKGLALYGVSSVAGGIFGFVSHGMQMIMILVVGSASLLYTLYLEQKALKKSKQSATGTAQ